MPGSAKAWTLGLKLHKPYDFGSLEVFKFRLRLTFEQPRVEFWSRFELLKLEQGTRDVDSYIQYIRHLTSCITANPLEEQTLITLFMQGLTDGPVKIYLFQKDFNTLEEVFWVAEQEELSVKQAHVNSSSYHPRPHES